MNKKIELQNQINLIEARINQISNSEHYSDIDKETKIAVEKKLLEKTQLQLIKEIEVESEKI